VIYEKEDNLFLTYKGTKYRVTERHEYGRPKTDWNNYDIVYVLENGQRIVSSHWTYGLVDPITHQWLLRAYMPVRLIRQAMKDSEYFWKSIPKDEFYWGGMIPVPFTKP